MTLPAVTCLGAGIVPAFTSAGRLVGWPGRMAVPAPSPGEGVRQPGYGPFAVMPHIVVPAAELARRMPPGAGIALNPGAEASVPKESATWPRPWWSRRAPQVVALDDPAGEPAQLEASGKTERAGKQS